MSDKYDFDLFTIGAGSGGVRASRVAAAHGAKVAIAEEHRVGGTCVIRGCVPKKMLIYGAHFAEDLKDARNFGWSTENAKFDWVTLRDNVLNDVDRLEGAYTETLENNDVSIYHERAEITEGLGETQDVTLPVQLNEQLSIELCAVPRDLPSRGMEFGHGSAGEHFVARHRGAPEFLDVGDDELGAFVVAHIRCLFRVVHGIGEIADEGHLLPPADHLLDGEGASEDTHIRVHSHDEHAVDVFQRHVRVDIRPVVGDDVLVLIDADAGVLPRPGALALRCRIERCCSPRRPP